MSLRGTWSQVVISQGRLASVPGVWLWNTAGYLLLEAIYSAVNEAGKSSTLSRAGHLHFSIGRGKNCFWAVLTNVLPFLGERLVFLGLPWAHLCSGSCPGGAGNGVTHLAGTREKAGLTYSPWGTTQNTLSKANHKSCVPPIHRGQGEKEGSEMAPMIMWERVTTLALKMIFFSVKGVPGGLGNFNKTAAAWG